jgi:hypothetical protein
MTLLDCEKHQVKKVGRTSASSVESRSQSLACPTLLVHLAQFGGIE